jgi:hypothetical protein
MSLAYKLGKEHHALGHSIYYNPFRHKGSGQDYLVWEAGWKSILGRLAD